MPVTPSTRSVNMILQEIWCRIELESHKENPTVVVYDDVTKRKNDEKDEDEVNDADIEKTDDADTNSHTN
nr:hypothetical protein [Tanacetum cinerariifolium]